MKKLDALLTEWAEHQVNIMHRSGFSGINIIEKILKDPGIGSGGSKHRILFWPKNKRIARMDKAMHQISTYSQVCLVVQYGRIVQIHNGQILEKKDFSRKTGHSVAFFDICVRDAKKKIRYLLKTYAKADKINKINAT